MLYRRRKKKKTARVWNHRHLLFILYGSTLSLTTAIGIVIIGYMLLGLPAIHSFRSYSPPTVTRVLDSEGRALAYWYRERRWPVSRYRIPNSLVQAFLAAEDARFYEHPGIDFLGVLRAVVRNVEAGAIVQGASTITQQVTRSLLLSPERSWLRKIKEAILAWDIDAALTKDEILTIYLNQIYLGQGAYGVEAAARTYFGKHVEDLNLAESSLVAGLVQAPSRYNPLKHFKRAKARQRYVLKRMVQEGYITPEESRKALEAPLRFRSLKLSPPGGSEYFLAEVRKELEARYGKERLLTDGFTVVTTLNRDLQAQADRAVRSGLESLTARHADDAGLSSSIQGALIAMDVSNGAVRAMWGGKDFTRSQFNLATQARRQTGSAFKPIIYAAALARGILSPNSVLVDEPISLPGAAPGVRWKPENFDRRFLGPVTVRSALINSRNIVSVKVAQMAGLDSIHALARKMGIAVPLADDLSLALGSSAVPLIQMVQAYSTFPTLGKTVKPRFIQEVRDRHGRILESIETVSTPVMDPVTAYQMVNLLEGVVSGGTGRCARKLGISVAGKTGTTNDYRDAWFIGFTPDMVAGVWVGRDDGEPLGSRETGGRVACPIWTSFMAATLETAPDRHFMIPEGIALKPVDKVTGEEISPTDEQSRRLVWEAVRQDGVPSAASSAPDKKSRSSILKKLRDLFF